MVMLSIKNMRSVLICRWGFLARLFHSALAQLHNWNVALRGILRESCTVRKTVMLRPVWFLIYLNFQIKKCVQQWFKNHFHVGLFLPHSPCVPLSFRRGSVGVSSCLVTCWCSWCSSVLDGDALWQTKALQDVVFHLGAGSVSVLLC